MLHPEIKLIGQRILQPTLKFGFKLTVDRVCTDRLLKSTFYCQHFYRGLQNKLNLIIYKNTRTNAFLVQIVLSLCLLVIDLGVYFWIEREQEASGEIGACGNIADSEAQSLNSHPHSMNSRRHSLNSQPHSTQLTRANCGRSGRASANCGRWSFETLRGLRG
eukprot:2743916-Rhodomonas_salina.1